MNKILNIIKKNIKLLLRSKTSALIILLGPLLIIMLVGLAFNSPGMAKINLGYYSPEYTNLTNSFIQVLEEKDYNLKKFNSAEECKIGLGSGTVHLCIVFPVDFRVDNSKTNTIDFLVDNSKINFFQSVVDSIESDFNKKALELSTGMTMELLSKLNETSSEIYDKSTIVKELKKENIDTIVDIDSAAKQVTAIDVNFDLEASGINDVKKGGKDAIDQITQLKNRAQEAIDVTNDFLDAVEDFSDNSNISSGDRAEIVSIINDTQTNIEGLENKLNNTINSYNTTQNINDYILKLSGNLRTLDTRLDTAAKAKDASAQKVLDLKKRINNSINKVLVVESTFNVILSNIEKTKITNLDTIVNPIKKNIISVVTEESQLNFYFPYLITLIIMFIGLLLASTLVILEKTSKAYFRNFVTPTADMSFIFATYLTTMIILFVQVIILLFFYALFFKKEMFPQTGSVALILFLTTTLFTLLGMLIGNLLSSEETGTLTSISIGSTLLFISDIIFPLERMPVYIAEIARQYNPFVVCSEILRKSMVHNIAVKNMQQQIITVIIFILMLGFLVILTYKYVKKHFLIRYSGFLIRRGLRKRIEKQSAEKMLETMKTLPEDQYFQTKEGKKIGNIRDIANFIDKLKKEEFKEYVNEEKNLFGDWVTHTLKNDILAMHLYKTTKQDKTAAILRDATHDFDDMEKEDKKETEKQQSKYAKDKAKEEKIKNKSL